MLTGKDYDGCSPRSNEKTGALSQRPQIGRNIAGFRVADSKLRHLGRRQYRVGSLNPAHHVFGRVRQISGNVGLACKMLERGRGLPCRTCDSGYSVAAAASVTLNQVCTALGVSFDPRLSISQSLFVRTFAAGDKQERNYTCGDYSVQRRSRAARTTASRAGDFAAFSAVVR